MKLVRLIGNCAPDPDIDFQFTEYMYLHRRHAIIIAADVYCSRKLP